MISAFHSEADSLPFHAEGGGLSGARFDEGGEATASCDAGVPGEVAGFGDSLSV